MKSLLGLPGMSSNNVGVQILQKEMKQADATCTWLIAQYNKFGNSLGIQIHRVRLQTFVCLEDPTIDSRAENA